MVALIIGWLGTNELATSEVTQQCMFLFVVLMFSIAKTTRIMVSQAIRGECYQVVKRIEEGYLIISTLFLWLYRQYFPVFSKFLESLYLKQIFHGYAKIINLIKILFILFSFSIIFDIWRSILSGALRGFYNTRIPM
ncbi:MATE family efflux transporter [Candidatus Coxiella mudrowiae]|uniref:MATE family efflux transporter n=1 Tax=Candidatus Coxiella mudrowiae TaxID=2054173 RepID=UPI001EFF0D58|nr:MATE family efflux transporter [Candidatus Coxiella mudrowiae]